MQTDAERARKEERLRLEKLRQTSGAYDDAVMREARKDTTSRKGKKQVKVRKEATEDLARKAKRQANKDIQDTLEKGALSEIKKKALAGEKDESGMPYTTIYKMITGKTIKQNMNNGGAVIKKSIGPSDYRKGGMVLSTVDNRKNK
jgi:uncharacterized FlaG/YvyC family protein